MDVSSHESEVGETIYLIFHVTFKHLGRYVSGRFENFGIHLSTNKSVGHRRKPLMGLAWWVKTNTMQEVHTGNTDGLCQETQR